MKNFKTLLCFTVLAGAGFYPNFAVAVDALDPCKVVEEEIIPLRVPNFDQAALWKKTSGVKGAERPRALMQVVDGGQIMVGSSIPYDDKTGLGSPEIQMVRTDKNGKIVVEKWITVKNLKTVADALLLKDRVIVLSQVGTDKDDGIVLHFINGAGVERSSTPITDKKLRLIPKSIMAAVGGQHLIIAAEAISRTNPDDSYSVLIWTDKDGKKLVQKEYLPGVKNKPEYVGRLDNGEIVMTGRVKTEDDRDAGWVLRLSSKGDILYQRPYARGGDSVVRRAISAGNGEVIIVGDALPAATGDKAAWVMRLDSEGNPIWQKYLTGKYAYSGIDVVALGDGRLNVLMAGKPTNAGGRAYARVVTMSMDGVLIGDESFIEGSNAIPVRLIEQEGKRYLLGLAETGFSKDNVGEELKYIAYDSWILGLQGLPEFTNPCAGAPTRTLDDLP